MHPWIFTVIDYTVDWINFHTVTLIAALTKSFLQELLDHMFVYEGL